MAQTIKDSVNSLIGNLSVADNDWFVVLLNDAITEIIDRMIELDPRKVTLFSKVEK